MSLEAMCLVFDMRNPVPPDKATSEGDAFGQWYEHTITDNPRGACIHNGVSEQTDILAGRLYWIADSAVVRYEQEDQNFDDTNTQILTDMQLARMSMANLHAAKRAYRAQMAGDGAGACTLRVSSNRISDDMETPPTPWTKDIAMTSSSGDIEFRPYPQSVSMFDVRVQEIASSDRTKGYRIKHFAFEIGTDGRMRHLPVSARYT